MTSTKRSTTHLLRCGILALLCAAFVLPLTFFTPKADAQVSFHVQIGTPPPVCPYGYYDYAPYACAPMGYYGPGYFYNGIFVGVGPWAYWGYRHGWGYHRFYGPGGGRYIYYPDHRPWTYREYYYRPGYFHDDHGWHRGNAYGHYDHGNRGWHGDHGHYDRGWHGDHDHGRGDRDWHDDRGHGDHGRGH